MRPRLSVSFRTIYDCDNKYTHVIAGAVVQTLSPAIQICVCFHVLPLCVGPSPLELIVGPWSLQQHTPVRSGKGAKAAFLVKFECTRVPHATLQCQHTLPVPQPHVVFAAILLASCRCECPMAVWLAVDTVALVHAIPRRHHTIVHFTIAPISLQLGAIRLLTMPFTVPNALRKNDRRRKSRLETGMVGLSALFATGSVALHAPIRIRLCTRPH